METAPGGVNGYAPASAAPRPSESMPSAEEPEAVREPSGTVRIAQRVLRTIVEQAALSVPGVARMAHRSTRWPGSLGWSRPQHGVGLDVHGDQVAIDLYLIVRPSTNMVEVGMAVQDAVGEAVEHILGMHADQINVLVRDVA
jgi:uncharacterized alkaline shock family protein YloU